MIRWPWQKRSAPTPDWARAVVAEIPTEQLADHIVSFAEGMVRDRDPLKVAQHRAKLHAACERVGSLLAQPPSPEPAGRWETHPDEDGAMIRVRWSVPDARGCHLYAAHYPGTTWGQAAAERTARDFNASGKPPRIPCGGGAMR